MKLLHLAQKTFLQFDHFSKAGILHFSSTKQAWANGQKPRFTGDSLHLFDGFRKELASAMAISKNQFVFPRQVHSDTVFTIRDITDWQENTLCDALITNIPGVVLTVQTADCVPILLYDPISRAIGIIHAGWRGTVAQITSKCILQMQQEYGCLPQNILAGIGPSIHLHAYEVGTEVIEAVGAHLDDYEGLLKPAPMPEKAFFDLWEANKQQLEKAGLLTKNIELTGLCTWSHPDLFFSARRDGSETGRMVSGIMLK